MTRIVTCFGLVIVCGLAAGRPAAAQFGGNGGQGFDQEAQLEAFKPTGPAARKADDLIRGYTARIEKEIERDRKELARLHAELKELIDLRYDMDTAIAEIRGELAAKGAYSADPIIQNQPGTQDRRPLQPNSQVQGLGLRRDLFYGLGSALPKEPSPEQRDQLRRLAPRASLKRMIERLRDEVEETRTEVDQLAYKLLELRAGVPISRQAFGGMGGGMGGMGGGIGIGNPWFGSIGMQGGMGGMGAGMR
jgi:hypothetical protein